MSTRSFTDSSRSASPPESREPPPTLGSSRLVAAMLLFAVTMPACAAVYVSLGAPIAIPATVAVALTALAWLPRLRRPSPWPAVGRVAGFQTFIATLVALMAQYTEQWLAHLPATVMHLFPGAYPPGVSYSEHAMIAVFPLAASSLFLLGALALYNRHPVGEGAAWLLFFWALVSALAPFTYAALGGGAVRYVGGMGTAPIVAGCGIRGIRRLRSMIAEAGPRREDGR